MGGNRRYSIRGFSAALLGDYKGALPFGTRLLLEHGDRKVVVEVNDYGPGRQGKSRVLDLSRAAAALLLGKQLDEVTPLQAGVIHLDRITIVPNDAALGSA